MVNYVSNQRDFPDNALVFLFQEKKQSHANNVVSSKYKQVWGSMCIVPQR